MPQDTLKVSPTDLTPSLEKRLGAYALTAVTALLSSAVPSQAEIIYTKANKSIAPNSHFNLDLNHDKNHRLHAVESVFCFVAIPIGHAAPNRRRQTQRRHLSLLLRNPAKDERRDRTQPEVFVGEIPAHGSHFQVIGVHLQWWALLQRQPQISGPALHHQGKSSLRVGPPQRNFQWTRHDD